MNVCFVGLYAYNYCSMNNTNRIYSHILVTLCESLAGPGNGSMECELWMFGDTCQPLCRPGYDLADGTPLFYHCGLGESVWEPDNPPADCQGSKC